MALFLNMKFPKQGIIKATAAITAVSMLSGCGLFTKHSAQIQTGEQSDRKTVPFEQMEIHEPNTQEILKEIESLTAQIDQCKTAKELLEKEEKLSEMTTQFSTSSSLADLKSYLNSSDPEMRKLSETFSVEGEQISSAVNEYLRKVMESPLKDEYRKEMGEYISSQIDKQLKTDSPEAIEPMQKWHELNNQYNDRLSNLRVEVDGKQMRIEEVMEDSSFTGEQLYKIVGDYYLGNYEEFANLYLDMIKLDKQAAKACGYDDAVQWRYDSFGRDYTPEDSEKMFGEIKKWFVPWMDQAEYTDVMSMPVPQEEGVQKVKELVSTHDPLLKEVWDFMEKNNVFSFEAAEDKMSGIAFTMHLDEYDTPFVYSYWSGSLKDAFTAVHEFGHAVDNYTQFENEAYSTDLDKAETFSQGLEQILQQKVAKAVGADPQEVMQAVRMDMVEAITYQAALEEFQIKAYRLDDNATADDLAELYADILSEYGFYSIFGDYDPTWFEVTHLFDAPFYTMSYVTSATAAVELGRMEAEKEGAGFKAWMNLLKTDRNQSFEDFLKAAGIASPFDKGRIQECGEFLKKNLVKPGLKKAA